MLDLNALADEEADAFLAEYVARSDERLQWLRERTGLALEPTRNGLIDAWSWYLRWYQDGEPDPVEETPMWWVADASDAERGLLPYDALWLIDGIGYHWASVLRHDRPQLEWKRYEGKVGPPPHCQNQPVLIPRTAPPDALPLTPVQIVYRGAMGAERAAGDPHPSRMDRECAKPDLLASRHAYWIQKIDQVTGR